MYTVNAKCLVFQHICRYRKDNRESQWGRSNPSLKHKIDEIKVSLAHSG